MKLLRRRACDRYAAQLSGTVDAATIDLQLRRHVRSCARCRRQLSQYRSIRSVLRSLPTQIPLPSTQEATQAQRRRRVLSGAAGGLGLVSVAVAVGTRRRGS